MSQQIPPVQQLEFHGLHLAGNPIGRPRGTAAVCHNVRVMPGFWLRARGGYKARANAAGNWTQFRSFRPPDFPGSTAHIGQIKFTSGANNGQVWWNWFSVYPAYLITPTPSERIFTDNDGGFANSNPVAVTNLSDRLLVYNGLGVQDANGSRPPFTTIAQDMNRYYGLDAYCPGAKPTVSWSGGAGFNQVAVGVDIYVGLYHAPTEHYSNAVKVGSISAQSGFGTITVSNLQRLKASYHGPAEQAELYYVFYATVDSQAEYKVPYMILDVDMLGPLKVAVTATSASLSVAGDTDNGWVLNATKEAPFDNHPPRPMRDVALCNGRLYGALMDGGSGFGEAFQYPPSGKELGAVVWSRAFGDVKTIDQLGDPLQSWPLKNIAHTPTYEQPIALHPDLDDVGLIVYTSTSTFLLLELAEGGVHKYEPISRVHGIRLKTTLAATPYGLVWVTQRNQIVMLERGSRSLIVLSENYQGALAGKTPTCADYLLDPVHQIDRYEVFFSDGTSLCHDFALGGEAHTSSRKNATAAMTAVDSIGRQHFLFANTGIYTHEAQPEDGLIPTTDQVFDAGLQTYQTHQIDGEYVRNWDDFGDANVRKELLQVDVIGDAGASAALGGRAVEVEWYADFEEVKESNKAVTTPAPIQQSTTNSTYPFKLSKFHQFWFKIRLKFRGHSSDDASFATHASPATQGDRAKNFYGSILGMLAHIGRTSENRA